MKRFFNAALFLLIAPAVMIAQDNNNAKKPRFILSANVNYSYRIAKIDDSFNSLQRDYLQKIKSGVSYDFSAYYMVNHLGFGIKYNAYRSTGHINNADIIAPNGQSGFGTVSDDITISFIGTGVIYELGNPSSKHKGYTEATLGYMHYNNDAYALGNYNYKAGTLGASLSISYQYEAFKNFSFGPRFSFTGGSISKFTLTGPDGYKETINLDGDKTENLSRIDIGVVASYKF